MSEISLPDQILLAVLAATDAVFLPDQGNATAYFLHAAVWIRRVTATYGLAGIDAMNHESRAAVSGDDPGQVDEAAGRRGRRSKDDKDLPGVDSTVWVSAGRCEHEVGICIAVEIYERNALRKTMALNETPNGHSVHAIQRREFKDRGKRWLRGATPEDDVAFTNFGLAPIVPSPGGTNRQVADAITVKVSAAVDRNSRTIDSHAAFNVPSNAIEDEPLCAVSGQNFAQLDRAGKTGAAIEYEHAAGFQSLRIGRCPNSADHYVVDAVLLSPKAASMRRSSSDSTRRRGRFTTFWL